MIASLISAHGLSTGLFTSPHLDRVEQRFEVAGRTIAPAELAEAMALLAPIVDMYEERTGDGITYFEAITALAFAWFAERSVDVGVIETGLGGRWDATNAATSEVAVVTNIDLEHTEYLGDTIIAIAAEKLAILDTGADLVTGDMHSDALVVAEARASNRPPAGSVSDRSTARSMRRPRITDGFSTWQGSTANTPESTCGCAVGIRSPTLQLRLPRSSVSSIELSMRRRFVRPQPWWYRQADSRSWGESHGC